MSINSDGAQSSQSYDKIIIDRVIMSFAVNNEVGVSQTRLKLIYQLTSIVSNNTSISQNSKKSQIQVCFLSLANLRFLRLMICLMTYDFHDSCLI